MSGQFEVGKCTFLFRVGELSNKVSEMGKEIVVHCGLTKTGSTSVQLYFSKHADWARRNGFCYHEAENGGQFAFVRRERGKELLKAWKASGMERLFISVETLYKSYWDKAQSFWDVLEQSGYPVRVVLVARAQPLWIQSIYQQHIVQWELRYLHDIHSFIDEFRRDMDYHAHVKYLMRKGFDVSVLSYEAAKQQGGTIQEFLRFLDLDPAEESREIRSNPSIGRSGALLLQEMNRQGLITKRNEYVGLLKALKKKTKHQPRFGYLSDEECQKIWADCEDSNAELAKYMPPGHYDMFRAAPLLPRPDKDSFRADMADLMAQFFLDEM